MSPRSQFGRRRRDRHTVGSPDSARDLQNLRLAQLPFCQEKSLVNDMTVNAQNSNAFVAAPQTFGLDARPAMPAMQDNPHRRGTGDAGSLRHIMGLLLRRAGQGGG